MLSLLNYILRHHHDILLRGSWNYVHYLRHHHELSPKGSWNYVHYMRHHHEISPRDSWNYILYMRHHHEISPRDSWNYVLIHIIFMSHQPYIELSCIPISCQYTTNHPLIFHMHIHTKLIKSSLYNQISHAYSHTSYFQ